MFLKITFFSLRIDFHQNLISSVFCPIFRKERKSLLFFTQKRLYLPKVLEKLVLYWFLISQYKKN